MQIFLFKTVSFKNKFLNENDFFIFFLRLLAAYKIYSVFSKIGAINQFKSVYLRSAGIHPVYMVQFTTNTYDTSMQTINIALY